MTSVSGVSAAPRAPGESRAAFAWLVRADPGRQTAVIIGAFTLWRLILAFAAGPGTDEAYSISVSRELALSYFDHPPLHYWIAHAEGLVLGFGRADRLAFIALFAGTSWLMFALTRRLFGAAAGVWACLGLSLSPFFTLAAGSWVLPDGPLDAFLTAAALALAAGWFGEGSPHELPLRSWLLTGVLIGLAGLSKYHAALFCAGLALFLVTTPRWRELARPGPWLAALVVLAVLAPVLVWNAQHHWASITFQCARGAPSHLSLVGPLIELAGQAGLLTPWVAAPLVLAGWRALRAGPADERRWLCLMLAAPPIILFTLTPLQGVKALPHWPMSGWLMLFPLLGELMARVAATRAWPKWWAAAGAMAVVVLGAAYVADAQTGFVWAVSGGRLTDPSRETIDWAPVRDELARRGLFDGPDQFLAAPIWSDAGKLDLALRGRRRVVVLSRDSRQYGYRVDPAALVGQDVIIVGRKDILGQRLPELSGYFRSVDVLAPDWLGRPGLREMQITIVHAHGLLRPYPWLSRQ